jgi:tRNA(Ile)-lysidine synthase
LLAVHVNHGLRGTAARRDEIFVTQLCARWGVACKVYAPDVRGAAARSKWSWEEAGRKLRQGCFLQAASEFRARAVVLAHHQDDQAETVLFNFLRGTGLRGLGGMLPVRAFPHPQAPAGLKLLRPLLGLGKTELLAYCRKHRLTWRHDQSNEDTAFTRNFIRQRLLPWLEKKINPALRQVLARTAENAAHDEAYLEKCAQKALRACKPEWGDSRGALQRKPLARLDTALRFRVLSLAWDQLGIPQKSQAHLAALEQAVLGSDSYAGDLPGKWRARLGLKSLELFQVLAPKTGRASVLLNPSSPFGVHTQIYAHPVKLRSVPAGSSFIYVDAKKIADTLHCRVRQPGDSMRPLGLGGQHKEIKKILAEMRVPAAKRATWPLVVMGREIIWVYQGPMAETVKLDGATRRILKLTLKAG